ncbi:MAG: hypothetical protein E7399_09705 [Ruminococcaceae bacterium]|nr:hypothetical protein [Oscillospiraceae bacterium]
MYLAPESNGLKKVLKYCCGLVLLITLLIPVLNGYTSSKKDASYFKSFFDIQISENEWETKTTSDSALRSTVTETAYAIMTYICTEYDIVSKRINISVITNGEGEEAEICEIQVFIIDCSSETSKLIQQDLKEKLKTNILVLGK